MSELLLENGEFYNPEFKIRIKDVASPAVAHGLVTVGIGDAWFPIPTLDEAYVGAGWVGTKVNRFGELMVISFCAHHEDAPNQDALQWYSGRADKGFFNSIQGCSPIEVGREIGNIVGSHVDTLQKQAALAVAIHQRLYGSEYAP